MISFTEFLSQKSNEYLCCLLCGFCLSNPIGPSYPYCVQDKEKPSSAVQELCKKLKLQLEELGIPREEPPEDEDQTQIKNLFQQLQDQLAELSR